MKWMFAAVVALGVSVGLSLSWSVRGMMEPTENLVRRPIAEFSPVSLLILSEFLLDYPEGLPLIKKALTLGHDVGILMNQIPEEGSDHKLKDFAAEIEKGRLQLIPFAHESIWVRDYLGIQSSRSMMGHSVNEIIDFRYKEDFHVEDLGSHQLALTCPQSVIQIPLSLDGGNFLSNGQDCFMGADSTSLIVDEGGYQVLIQALKSEVGCETVYYFQDPPHEHVDMYLKVVSKDVVLVAEIPDLILEKTSSLDPVTAERILHLAHKMDAVAEQLEHKFQVVRIVTPLFTSEVLSSYINSVLLQDDILMPRYQFPDHLDQLGFTRGLMTEIEAGVEVRLEELGLKVHWIDASEVIKGGGALHCITYQIHRAEQSVAH
ncbi:agmatine deiminase family protein [Pseudobacteriovorax antillogorgiicola]|uniref:Agmatine/peptidylarginine deiminase n=1 Tax=Pseudobacteriovorax antillogorgiicola TaxID=1513793 RepID=A0A1Y6CE43_9BACT|nr:agmatine deiminase family protein [Pseudobacteriovorax antillogorgiicola]TCS47995.1 agmatine/peptidylarginine deiminase [Pseudobacteriovorax antillogorgiicola]SMF58488.1 Agmatine/peptidylarginine deiminase [Pseudobacteriovorax antillogorgiicola]